MQEARLNGNLVFSFEKLMIHFYFYKFMDEIIDTEFVQYTEVRKSKNELPQICPFHLLN